MCFTVLTFDFLQSSYKYVNPVKSLFDKDCRNIASESSTTGVDNDDTGFDDYTFR